MLRVSLPKSVRFEVFKRDKFKCQYCGEEAPNVILEVDHIVPVSKGGTNDIFNLVTSCRDCNRGKSDKKLDDDTVVKKQKRQLDELQERREQIEMMIRWKEELTEETKMEIEAIERLIFSNAEKRITEYAKKEVKRLIKRFGFKDVYEATEIAFDRYYDGSPESKVEAFRKIGGICYNREKQFLEKMASKKRD